MHPFDERDRQSVLRDLESPDEDVRRLAAGIEGVKGVKAILDEHTRLGEPEVARSVPTGGARSGTATPTITPALVLSDSGASSRSTYVSRAAPSGVCTPPSYPL